MSYFVQEIRNMQDVEAVVTMAADFHKENRPELAFSADKVRAVGAQILDDYTRSAMNAFVCYKDDEPVGFLVATCTTYMFSEQVVANQELVYLQPTYRGLTPFRKLMKALDEWASINGAVEVYTGVSVHEPEKADKISRLLDRIGYKKVGYYHMKGVNR